MAGNAEMVVFVEERLAEEEKVARHAGGDSWRCPAGTPGEVHDRTSGIAFTVRDASYDRHIALQDPSRTLARIRTYRVLLSEYAEVWDKDTDRPHDDFASGRAVGLGFAVRQLAAEFAGHPDYTAKWLPRYLR
ncbi:DUF6221 family protein [Streptomyces sp. NPDC002133]|uniref:DUF6221 family protein n=1 Tax=Streptomyces sp. NPDC002133 TaxID=3154409 RepID=UPI00333499DC